MQKWAGGKNAHTPRSRVESAPRSSLAPLPNSMPARFAFFPVLLFVDLRERAAVTLDASPRRRRFVGRLPPHYPFSFSPSFSPLSLTLSPLS